MTNSAAGCFFLPIILFFGFFGILIIGFIALVIYLVNKGRQDSWTGEVIDKIYKQRRDMESNQMRHFFTLVFKTTDGRTKKIGVAQSIYDQYKIGDKAKKEKRKLFIEKISS